MDHLGPDALRLDGRVALVTGAARGIGAATSLLLAEAGATVATVDRDGDDLDAVVARIAGAPNRGAGGAGPSAVLDVRDADAVDRFVDELARYRGHIDVLVNNAGGTFHADVLSVSPKGEAALIAENFTQVTHLVRRVVPHMPAEGGAIVNVTSVEAHQAAPGYGTYAAMKAAVASLTRTLALELAPRRIRVNAVAPDAVPTGGEAGARDQLLAGERHYRPAHLPPLGHFGEPSDVAAAILFLASDLARFVTGTTVHVDGGTRAAGGWHRLAGDET